MTCSKCRRLFHSDGPFRSGDAYPVPICWDCKPKAKR